MYGPPHTGADLRAWRRGLAPYYEEAKRFKIINMMAKVNSNTLDRH